MILREIVANSMPIENMDVVSRYYIGEFVLEAIASAGYRILGPGEWDKETVERCAEVAETATDFRDHPRLSPGSELNAWWSGQEVGHEDAASAIRALAKEKQGY